MKSVLVAALMVLMATPAVLAEGDWVEGTVREVPRPQEVEPFGTTPSGITIGRLSYGVVFGTQQQAFLDLRYRSGDTAYGITSNLDFTPISSSFGSSQVSVHYALPHVALRLGLDSWAVELSRPITAGVEFQFLVGSLGQAVQLSAQREGWTLIGTVQWQKGLPTMAVVLQSTTSFIVGE